MVRIYQIFNITLAYHILILKKKTNKAARLNTKENKDVGGINLNIVIKKITNNNTNQIFDYYLFL
jgi:hypothetical protein